MGLFRNVLFNLGMFMGFLDIFFSFFFFEHLSIWLRWAFVASCGIFRCGAQTL